MGLETINNVYQLFNKEFNNFCEETYKYGQASIIALILKCKHNTDKYKIEDLTLYVDEFMKNDDRLKNYVYDCMKLY